LQQKIGIKPLTYSAKPLHWILLTMFFGQIGVLLTQERKTGQVLFLMRKRYGFMPCSFVGKDSPVVADTSVLK